MAKTKPTGEMPFLDHLEELRWRILWSLLALIAGSAIGFYLVRNHDVIELLKQPIVDFLPDGKLFVVRPTDAFFLTLKLAIAVGAVLASPIIAWQLWVFLSPALYEKEKRYVVPVLAGGFVLFVGGAVMAYLWVLPAALWFLYGFGFGDLEWIITADHYFGFAIQVILGFGLAFQLPLLMMLLALVGLVTPEFLGRNRRYALLVVAVGAALLTPPDVVSMAMMMAPLVLLYEIGILLAKGVTRRRNLPSTGAVLVLVGTLVLDGGALQAQQRAGEGLLARDTVQGVGVGAGADSLEPQRSGEPIDSAAARRLGLPTGPSRTLPTADSVMRGLVDLPGFRATRFAADSLTFHAKTQRIDLAGSALVEREGSMLEAATVSFLQAECRIDAAGEPRLFDGGTVLIGEGMQYDTCERRGIVARALTKFDQSGVEWFLRGHLAIDSASSRIYARRSSITSSDLPLPDYHFAAGRIKWVSNTVLVARPAVLYVRDVPILWLPFIFQDMRRGRRSGMLIPRFGINDLVRPNAGYQRHISNIGYYFALNDYVDLQASLDWFSGGYVSLNGQLRYRWLDRFISGGVSFSRIYESAVDEAPGSRSLRLQLSHQQSFNSRTRINASIDYATSARVVERNAVDPFLATANLRSSANFSKQFDWGSLSVGGSRTQDLTNDLVTQAFPNVNLTPVPINLSEAVTWSPTFSFATNKTSHQASGVIDLPPVGGVPQQDSLFSSNTNTTMRLSTPLRVGRWNWPNDFNVTHMVNDRRSTLTVEDPMDSTLSSVRFYGEDFSTAVDWNTSIGLPSLFSSTWKLQPSIGIQNSTSGPFMIRNRNTNGRFVSQGKRLSFAASLTPTIFGFFPGVGPLSRIRHAVSPQLRWGYAPSATVPEDFARAMDPTGRRVMLQSNPVHTIGASISQTFEGKFQPPPGDTTGGQNARKIKLLSVQTSSIEYDFEQAKGDGRSGWRTQSLSNQFTSDLLPGFSVSTTHDLWDGPVGFDTTRFSPFLTRVSARFRLSASTLAGLIGLITGKPRPAPPQATVDTVASEPGVQQEILRRPGPTYRAVDQVTSRGGRGQGFSAALTYDDSRTRPQAGATSVGTGELVNRTLGMAISFSPTRNWSVSWDTQYNLTTKEFGQHVVRLDRDLRRWRATFSFIKAPNGNFAVNFFINLIDQTDIKFQYDQRTIKR